MARERGYVVVFNPKAGGRAHEVLRGLRSRLDGRATAIVETTLDDSFGPRLREWIAQIRVDSAADPIVVAVGGDGTLSMLVNALEDPARTPIAVVPAGSGNDFAAAIGCSTPARAMDAIDAESIAAFDLGSVDGQRFLNSVGFGLHAEIARRAQGMRRRGYPPAASYYASALASLVSVRPMRASVTADGDCRRYDDAVMITANNGPTYGAGFLGAPGARFDDGLIDAYVFRDVAGFGRRLRLVNVVRAGKHAAEDNVIAVRARSLLLEFDQPVPIQVDGETGVTQRSQITLLPRGVLVVTSVGPSPYYGTAGAAPARI